MKRVIHFILISLLLIPCCAVQASHQPEFSTAGFFQLPNSGREVFSMNPAWRFHKGAVEGAETKALQPCGCFEREETVPALRSHHGKE